MARNSRSRRQVLKSVGAGAVGLSGITLPNRNVTSTASAAESDGPKLASVTVRHRRYGQDTVRSRLQRVHAHDCITSVTFTADQVPDTNGMVDILSSAGDVGHDHDTSSFVYLYPDDGDISKNPPSSTDDGSLRQTLDTMSQDQLAKHGIRRVNPSEISRTTRKNSRFDLSGERPTYIKSFDMDVEFGAENGTVISSPSTNK